MADKYCMKCGTFNRLNASRCRNCGKEFIVEIPVEQDDSKEKLQVLSISDASEPNRSLKITVGSIIQLAFVILFIGGPVAGLLWQYHQFASPVDISSENEILIWAIFGFIWFVSVPFTIKRIGKALDIFLNPKD